VSIYVADDLASGAVQYLLTFPDLLAMLGAFPASDPTNPGVPFLFLRNTYTRLEGQGGIKGTQGVALVCSNGGDWSSPSYQSSARFTRLQLEIYVDPIRDAGFQVVQPAETENRGWRTWSLADFHLHRLTPETVAWGTVTTVGCERLTGPVFYPIPDGDGMLRAEAFYGVSIFSAA
jgi:hypothetical protein